MGVLSDFGSGVYFYVARFTGAGSTWSPPE
jgi:hypothetical protein